MSGEYSEFPIRPKWRRIVVKRDEMPELTAGGIVVPNVDDRKSQTGVIVARGPECEDTRVGEHVLFGRLDGITTYEHEGVVYDIMDETDINAEVVIHV